jgi:hypothetical protein
MSISNAMFLFESIDMAVLSSQNASQLQRQPLPSLKDPISVDGLFNIQRD